MRMLPTVPLVRRLGSLQAKLKTLKPVDKVAKGSRLFAVYGSLDGIVFLSGVLFLKDFADAYTYESTFLIKKIFSNSNILAATKLSQNRLFLQSTFSRRRKQLVWQEKNSQRNIRNRLWHELHEFFRQKLSILSFRLQSWFVWNKCTGGSIWQSRIKLSSQRFFSSIFN